MTRVANKRRRAKQAGDVYIGRPGPWGNPFALRKESERNEVVRRYRTWLAAQVRSGEITRSALAALAQKTLVCWCAPKACHGDVLAKAAEWAASSEPIDNAEWMSG